VVEASYEDEHKCVFFIQLFLTLNALITYEH